MKMAQLEKRFILYDECPRKPEIGVIILKETTQMWNFAVNLRLSAVEYKI